MSNETVILSYPWPGIAEVRLNRPEQLNALVPAMFDALVRIGGQLAQDADLRAVILCGEGARVLRGAGPVLPARHGGRSGRCRCDTTR